MEQDQEQLNIFDPVKVDDDYFAKHYEEQEAFYEKLKTLPEIIVDLLFGLETPETIKTVASKNLLNPNQIASLSRLIRKISTAEVYLGDLVEQIKKELGTDEIKAKGIANDLIGKLFIDALADLKKMHAEKFGKPATDSPAEKINPGNVVNLRQKDN